MGGREEVARGKFPTENFAKKPKRDRSSFEPFSPRSVSNIKYDEALKSTLTAGLSNKCTYESETDTAEDHETNLDICKEHEGDDEDAGRGQAQVSPQLLADDLVRLPRGEHLEEDIRVEYRTNVKIKLVIFFRKRWNTKSSCMDTFAAEKARQMMKNGGCIFRQKNKRR